MATKRNRDMFANQTFCARFAGASGKLRAVTDEKVDGVGCAFGAVLDGVTALRRARSHNFQAFCFGACDGTVNFAYGIPHACVSIALQVRRRRSNARGSHPDANYETLLGVVYDPFLDEFWTALRGHPARLNGKIIRVSRRKHLREAIVAMGFAKYEVTMQKMLPAFNALVPRVRKMRLLGAAALSMTWVATGRLDAYKEYGVRLWDIAAGGLIVECAGGEFWHKPIEGEHTYQILVNNGWLRKKIEKIAGRV